MKRLLILVLLSSIFISGIAKANDTVTYVDLVRFAWQQSYAPKNLRVSVPGITQVPSNSSFFISNLIAGNKVFIHPVSEWKLQGKYVTTLLIRNKYCYPIKINIKKDLCGSWQAAVLYPYETLKPYSDKDKSLTLLFLISNQPFNNMMRACYGHA